MLSAVILAELGYPAMPLAGQLAHQRSVHPGPLVLRAAPLKSPTPTLDRDRHSVTTLADRYRLGLFQSEWVISAHFCMSPCRSDYIFPAEAGFGV